MEIVDIIGAGPAGSAAAFFMGQHGYNVRVYDHAPWPGFKACGWAVPIQIEKIIRIPREYILTKIKRFSIYLNDKLVHDKALGLWGYIIDKPGFLKHLLSYADFVKKHVKIATTYTKDGRPYPRILEDNMGKNATIIATGSAFTQFKRQGNNMKDLIYAVQYVTEVEENPLGHDTIELRFYGDMVGYLWVFPRGEKVLDIGVGGYAQPQEYVKILYEYVRKLTGIKPDTARVRGAYINISGVDVDLLSTNPYVIGEAAGFVYPLTGEGIRPSIASAKAVTEHILGSKKWRDPINSIVKWIKVQRILLDEAVKASRQSREELLEKLPLEYFIGLGIGELSARQILDLLRYIPTQTLASVVRKTVLG